MSNFLNKIPVSPITSFGNPSVPNGSTIGTNFSILQTGGYMEIYSLSGLTYTIPPSTTGIIEFSGNSIPIQLTKGSGSVFSPDVLTLNSDNISSGRRKLGMLAYVYETNKIYQFRIDNYDTLWNNATGATGPGGPTVVISDFGTTVKNNSAAGIALINAWTASTISGIGGYNDTNASWRVLSTGGSSSGGTSFTGGTVSGATIFTGGLTANTFSAGTYYNLPVSGVTGGTGISASSLNGLVTIVNTSPDQVVTISGGTGIQTGGTYPNFVITNTLPDQIVTITGGTNIKIDGTYPNFGLSVTGVTELFNNYLPLSGGTVTGATIFTNGLTANTISATTYQNLPVSGVTGGTGISANTTNGRVTIINTLPDQTVTISGGTNIKIEGTYPNFGINFTGSTGISGNFLPLSGGTVTGGTIFTSGLTANTISATTYLNLPKDIFVTGGTIGNGPDTTNNKITLNRNDGSGVTLSNLVDIVNVTKSEMDTIISLGEVIRGKTYKISGCDDSLYFNGTDDRGEDVYTTIYLMGLESDKLSESGIGIFYTPRYTSEGLIIFFDGINASNNGYYIWGGFVWQLKGGDGSYNSIDIFTLPNEFEIKYPFVNGEDDNLKSFYNEQYDDIIYDYPNDRIIYRNEQNSNIVSTTYENITYWVTKVGYYNPIRVFQWGHLVNFSGGSVIYNQQIINSYNENINYLGLSQQNFYFNNLSYQKDLFVDYNSYQNNFIFDNQSYQNDITISGSSGQNDIFLNNRSYQDRIILNDFSFQNQITLNNYSYQNRIDILGFGTDSAIQSYFNFNNGSYQNQIILQSGNGKPAIQSYFNFNNNSYQDNIDLIERRQNRLDFTNNSNQSNLGATSQDLLIFDSSTQFNGEDSLSQTNITIKNYDRDLSSVVGTEQDRFFIHDLPTDNTASVYIGKINNQLVQVTKPIDVFVTGGTYNSGTGIITFRYNSGTPFNVTGITTSSTFTGGTVTGATIFTNGLTANTISATTYQNLPVSGVTSGTGISANTTNGLVTIINTLPDQTVTISGGTGISTGGTYPNFVLTNTAPDQTVTISGGTNIEISGTYPNFGLSVTGVTELFNNYLPLSGGTVTGETIFTSGLTANTFSAGTYFNLPVSGVTGGTGISASTSDGLVTIVNTSPDQTVTITGGTNMEINGAYPNFGINFTGSTGASGDFLPLSGGTVSGATTFTSGLTASTLNVLGLTQTSGITSTGGITFKQVTINSSYTATTSDYMIDVTGGTFNVTLPSAVGIQGRLLVVKNNGGGAVTVQPVLGQNIDDKPFVILGETNTIQLASNGSNWIAISYNISTVNSSTGVFEFTGLSIASSTTFNVAPIKGWIVNDTTNPLSPQLYYIAYSGGVHTAIYVNTSTETWVYLTSGGTISQSNIELTEQQRRQNIFLGKLGHANKTNIINAFSQPDFVLSPLSQLRDMFQPIGFVNGGIYASPNGANLSFNTSAGYLYGLGINFASDTLSPNSLYVSGASPCTFQYRTQTGGTASNTTFIDPLNYDLNGVVTSITGTKATNQRIYLVQNGIFRVQYGQTEYNQLSAAIEGIGTEQFNTFSNFTNNGILIGILSVLSTATNLSDTSKARFFFTSKFGETVGSAGGISTTTLQQAYNNSSTPEIVTNSAEGALSIKNGTGNADNVTNLFEGVNTSGGVTSFITAAGGFSGSSISATIYENLPVSGVTGGTGVSANTTNGLVTIVNTLPDQTVTITGGTNIEINGTYPNFGINFTGSTGASGDFLPLSGGTVSGATIFTGGLTANTISATTITSPSISPYGLIVATSIGYQNIF